MAINDPANRLANKINDIVDSKIKKRTKKASLIKSGTVVRIDSDGMPWVSVSGADGETPVNGKILANVKPGDSVSVSIENGKCNILGNPDDPSIGSEAAKDVSNQEIKNAVEQNGIVNRAIDVSTNQTLEQVDGMIDDKVESVEDALEELDLKSGEDVRILRNQTASSINIANEVKEVAEATNQHFWYDDGGAHVTEVTQEEWKTSPSGFNSLFNSLGLLLRKALNNIAAFTHSTVTFFDGDGNEEDNVTASFGSNGAQIGKKTESHLILDNHSLTLTTPTGEDEETGEIYYTNTFKVSDKTPPGEISVYDEWIDFFDTTTGDISKSRGPWTLSFEAVDTDYVLYEYYDPSDPSGYGNVIPTQSKTTTSFTLVNTPYSMDLYGCVAVYRTRAYVKNRFLQFGSGSGNISGDLAISLGGSNTVNGEMGIALGDQLTVDAPNQTVVGFYNEPLGASAKFIVGAGNLHEAPYNPFVVYSDGTAHIENRNSSYVSLVPSANGDLIISLKRSDSSGINYTYRWYMSYAGSLARQQYSNGSWASPKYYLVRDDIHDLFSCSTISQTIGSIAAGSTKTLTFSAARTGYDPIAISGWYANGAAGLYPYMLRLNGSNIQCFLRNPTSSASSSTATIDVQVLYCRSSW